MAKSKVEVTFFHHSVLRTFPQFPHTTDKTVATIIRAWMMRSCTLDVDIADFETTSTFNQAGLCFSCPAVIHGPSRAATKPLAVMRVLLATNLITEEEASAHERRACAAKHIFAGSGGELFVHFVHFKPFDLNSFLKWVVPMNCGAPDLLCVVHKSSDKLQPAYQPLGCVHSEVCANEGDEGFIERITDHHFTKCLAHTAPLPLSPEAKIRARGGEMEQANLIKTLQFFANKQEVDAVDRRMVPIEAWAAFHPLFQHAIYDQSNALVLDPKPIAALLSKQLRPFLKILASANPSNTDQWRLTQLEITKLTSFLKETLAQVQGKWQAQGWNLKPFGGFAQWNEVELAHAYANIPCPESVEPFRTPDQQALNFAFMHMPSKSVRYVKQKTSLTVLRISADLQVQHFYEYYCKERAQLVDLDWAKSHRVEPAIEATGNREPIIKIGSFAEIKLFFELMCREFGCECATLASLVPVINLDAAHFEEMTNGLHCA